MSFLTKSTGEKAVAQESVEVGGVQPIIPAGTKLQCCVADAKWLPEDKNNNEHIGIYLHVTDPGPYKDFVVLHRLHVKDDSDKKRDKAIDFLASYDSKGKGLIVQADNAGKPLTDGLLSRALVGVNVLATFDIWEKTDNETGDKSPGGNWVRSIASIPKRVQEEHRAIEEKAKLQPEADDFDDDIPF